MEKAMAPHSSTLAWKIPWMEEPGGLQSMGSLRVGQDWATSLSLFTFMHWRGKWQPTPVFLPGESQGRRSLVGCPSMGSHRVGHDWSDLAAAVAKHWGDFLKKSVTNVVEIFPKFYWPFVTVYHIFHILKFLGCTYLCLPTVRRRFIDMS